MLSGLNISISTLAYGLPVGADIDYADELTLQKALTGRKQINPA
jgi:recombination protein RecR